MIELGKIQKLKVDRKTSIGVYLTSNNDEGEDGVLLPQKQIPEGINVGDEVEVFVYRDSEDRSIATTKKPKLEIGELAFLEVLETTRIGSFLDWGLEKDLFLPFKEQKQRVKKGKKYLVGLYVDKSKRLCATMYIYKLLSSESPYKVNDRVCGMIYNINKELGAFVAVDNKYHGLIPNHELYGAYNYGDEVNAIVTKIKEDGKLDLSLREKSYKEIDKDAKIILDKINTKGGVLLLNDKSSPDKIKEELKMSKGAFKRAVGRLLKEGKITFTEKGIEINKIKDNRQ